MASPHDNLDLLAGDIDSEWSITATADNLPATATKAGEAGKSHFVTSISGSFSVANIKLMTLKDGAGVIGNYHVNNQRDLVFANPLKLTAGNAAELSLAASGTATQIGAVTMSGLHPLELLSSLAGPHIGLGARPQAHLKEVKAIGKNTISIPLRPAPFGDGANEKSPLRNRRVLR